MAARCALQDGQLQGAETIVGLAAGAKQEVWNDLEALALRGGDQRHRMTQLLSQSERVELAAAGVHLIGHVQQHESRQADRKDRRGQHQLPIHVGCVQHQQNAVGDGYAGHIAGKHIDCDAGVFGVGGEAVDAGEIDQREVAATDTLHLAGVVFHGHAGVVCDLLAQAGETVEQGRLAAVWRPDERHGPQPLGRAGNLDRRRFDEVDDGCMTAHAVSPATFSFRKMCLAVSLRRPTSTPSMR